MVAGLFRTVVRGVSKSKKGIASTLKAGARTAKSAALSSARFIKAHKKLVLIGGVGVSAAVVSGVALKKFNDLTDKKFEITRISKPGVAKNIGDPETATENSWGLPGLPDLSILTSNSLLLWVLFIALIVIIAYVIYTMYTKKISIPKTKIPKISK